MGNILNIIKQQIDDQTREKLNTDLTRAKVRSIGPEHNQKIISDGNTISPDWTIGSYTLQRHTLELNKTGVSPVEFLRHTGNILWKLGKSVNQITSQYENVLAGLQLYVTTPVSIPISFAQNNGIFRVYIKYDGSEYQLVYDSSLSAQSMVHTTLPVGAWVSVICTYYANESGNIFCAISDYSLVNSWRLLDVTAPSTPVWTSLKAYYEVVKSETAVGRNVLSWVKDTSIDCAGNGVYKELKNDTGIDLKSRIPGTLLTTLFDEATQWATVNTNATLNIGDKVSFSSSLNDTDAVVTRELQVPKNLVVNPIFSSGLSKYKYSAHTSTKSDINSLFGKTHVEFQIFDNHVRGYLTAPTVDVSTANRHYITMYSNDGIMSRFRYDLAGYKVNPSRWHKHGGITSIESTIANNRSILRVVRATSTGTVASSHPSSNLFLTVVATYQLSVTASASRLTPFKLRARNCTTRNAVWTSPTLYADTGYLSNTVSFTPSAAGTSYLELTFNAKSVTYPSATIFLSSFSLSQTYNEDRYCKEYLKLNFYTSSHTACSATPFATLLLRDNSGIDIFSVVLGTFVQTPTFGVGRQIIYKPSDCKYVRLQYIATINTTSTLISLHRHFYSFVVATLENNHNLAVFATPYQVLRFSRSVATLNYGTSVYSRVTNHILDRPRRSEDASVITWYDNDIDDNTTYAYYLDAYDRSIFKNRSAFSSVAAVTSGDTVAPKAIADYQITGYAGGIEHAWTNPTALDFRLVQISTNAGFTDLIYQGSGRPNESSTFAEITNGTVLVTRYIRSIDSYNNISSAVSDTCTPLPANTTDLGFSVIMKNSMGNQLFPNSFGWYNESVIASINYTGSSPIASYFYSYNLPDYSPSWYGWYLFTGEMPVAIDGRYGFKFRVKDIYGNYSAESAIYSIFQDIVAPAFTSTDDSMFSSFGPYAGYNQLYWDYLYVGSDTSGLYKTCVKRSSCLNITANPNFDLVSPGVVEIPSGYILNSTTYDASLHDDTQSYSYSSHLKFTVKSDTATGTFYTNNLHVDASDSLFGMARICFPSMTTGAAMWKLLIRNVDTSAVVASITHPGSSQAKTSIWKYKHVKYTSPATGTYRLEYRPRILAPGNTHSYILLDSMFLTTNLTFATVAELLYPLNSYQDYKVGPWNSYLYSIQVEDLAGNTSTLSDCLFVRSVQNYKDVFRNMLNNSSFERVSYSASGTITPDDWEYRYPSGNGLYTEYLKTSQINVGSGYDGTNSLALHGDSGNLISQNGVTVLPFTGNVRQFVLSFYTKLENAGDNAVFGITGFNKNGISGKTKFGQVSLYGATTDYSRIAATFYVVVPSITNLSVSFGPVSGSGTVYIDAVQLEEKVDGLPPRDYYDTKSVTADYLQGNLIRGHMIEADSIYTNHLQAECITASLLAANCVLASNLSANCVLASNLSANCVLASNINADTITVDKLHLSGSSVYHRHNGDMRLFPCSGSATIGGVSVVLGTTDISIFQYAYLWAGLRHNSPLATGTFLATGFMSSGLLYGREAAQSDHTVGLLGTTYTHDYPILARTYPCATTDRTLMFLFRSSSGPGGVLNTYYSRRKNGARGTGGYAFARYLGNSYDDVWTTPVTFATLGSSWLTSVKYNSTTGSFLVWQGHMSQPYGSSIVDGAYRHRFTFLTSGGTITRHVTKTFYSLSLYGKSDFDFASGGATILFATYHSVSPFAATIKVAGYSTNTFSVVIPTLEIATYSGLSAVAGVLQSNKTSLQYTNIVRVEDNKYVITYSLWGSPFVFYKVIEQTGSTMSVLLGLNEDVPLYYNALGCETAPTDFSGGRPRLIKSYGNTVLAYSPGGMAKQSSGSVKYPIGGIGVHVSRVVATLSFETFFNSLG